MQSETVDFAPGAVTWRTGQNVVFDYGPFAPLCESVTSSTKPDVHNVLQRRTEPRPQMYRNFCEIWGVVFAVCEQTFIQTDTLIAIVHSSHT